METQELKDFETLINIFFPFAEELLRKYGEFLPYAGAINNQGEVISVGEYNSEQEGSENMISKLKDSLKKHKDTFIAGTVFYDVRTTDSASGEVTDAIAVFVEHKEGKTAFEFFYPYKISATDGLSIHESFGNSVTKEIF
jgi:hypothetical protein